MYIAPENLYQIARMRMEDRQSDADRYRLANEARAETRTSAFDKLQSLVVFVGIPLGVSLRSPASEPRSLDISIQ